MLTLRKSLKAQGIQEYVVVVALVVAALTAMQIYMKRGIQATVRSVADEIGLQDRAEEQDPHWAIVYEPGNAVYRRTSGIATPTPELPTQGATQRVLTAQSGAQTTYFDTTTTNTGNQTSSRNNF